MALGKMELGKLSWHQNLSISSVDIKEQKILRAVPFAVPLYFDLKDASTKITIIC